MKKFKSFFLIFVLAGITLVASAQKKVGVVTCMVDKQIDVSQLGGVGAVAFVATLAGDDNFDLTSVLNNFHDVFFKEYAKSFPFEIVPEETVLGNEAYQNYEDKHKEDDGSDTNKFFQRYITYGDYKAMNPSVVKNEKSNQYRLMQIFKDDLDGVMFVDLTYAFVPKLAVTAKVQASISLALYDKEGKKVFRIFESAVSKKTVGLVAGVPTAKAADIKPMCEDASEQLFEDLRETLPKIAKKSAKKF